MRQWLDIQSLFSVVTSKQKSTVHGSTICPGIDRSNSAKMIMRKIHADATHPRKTIASMRSLSQHRTVIRTTRAAVHCESVEGHCGRRPAELTALYPQHAE